MKSKVNYLKKVHEALHVPPISRRQLATKLGYPDQTFMVTQAVYDLIRLGKVQNIGKIRCSRTNVLVEGITSDQTYFKSENDYQLNLFE